MSGKQGSQTKGWEKRGPFSRRPKAGATPASQMPKFTDPIELKLGPIQIIYQNSHWRSSSATTMPAMKPIGPAIEDPRATKQRGESEEEVKELRREVEELREKNRRYEEEVFYLDFKVELLTDMLAIKNIEVRKFKGGRASDGGDAVDQKQSTSD